VTFKQAFATHALSGAAGGYAGNAVHQGFDILTGKRDSFDWGEFGMAGGQGMLSSLKSWGITAALSRFQRACFTAGTPLLTPEGSKLIEEFQPGDQLLSRSEFDEDGAVVAKAVEETFTRTARIWRLKAGGRVIRTTEEHPFYVPGVGWVETGL